MAKETIAAPKTAPVSSGNTVVGVVGIGDMGAGIATAILRSYPLVVCDLRREAVEKMVALGARSADSLQALADQCNVIIVVVVDDKQVNHVVGELLRHPGKLHTIIVSSTVLPSTVIALSEQASRVGLDLIDAAVNGGTEQAARGSLTLLIGGEDRVVQRCWPIFEAFGKTLYHIGPVGAGEVGKLINNMLSQGSNMLQLEAMQFADAYGISEDAVTEFLAIGTADSRGLRTWGRYDRMRRSHATFAGTQGMYDIFSKDMKNGVLAAGQRGVVLPIAGAISSMVVEKAKARDKLLEARGITPIPRCPICTHELAYPYRKAGRHPECTSGAPE